MILALITLSFSPFWIPSILTIVIFILLWINQTADYNHAMGGFFYFMLLILTLLIVWLVFFAIMYFTSRP